MDVAGLFAGTPAEVLTAGLAFARVSALFAAAPVFRGRNLPSLVKGGLALLIVLLLLPGLVPLALPTDIVSLLLLLVREVGLGLLLGTLVQLLFHAVQIAGQLADTEMGFQMAAVLDPMSGQQVPLVGNFLGMLSLLFYFSVNGHILLLRALGESFRIVPLGGLTFSFTPGLIVKSFTGMFALAVQMALPLIGVSLAVSLIFGLMAKAVPQMNVFIVGMPVKVIVLSLLLVIILPTFMYFFEHSLGAVFLRLADWLSAGIG